MNLNTTLLKEQVKSITVTALQVCEFHESTEYEVINQITFKLYDGTELTLQVNETNSTVTFDPATQVYVQSHEVVIK